MVGALRAVYILGEEMVPTHILYNYNYHLNHLGDTLYYSYLIEPSYIIM